MSSTIIADTCRTSSCVFFTNINNVVLVIIIVIMCTVQKSLTGTEGGEATNSYRAPAVRRSIGASCSNTVFVDERGLIYIHKDVKRINFSCVVELTTIFTRVTANSMTQGEL